MKLPFFAKYPYTNLEQLNIDWLLEKIGGFDERIRSNTERITLVEGRCDVIETRLDGHDEDIADLKQRMETAEGDIDSLEGRMDTAEGDIDSLEGRMDTAEGDIDSLEGRMDTAEGDIDNCEADIIDLKNKDAAIEDMIASQYDSSNTYHAGDYVIYNDILYKSIDTTSGDFDVTKWVQVNVTNEIKTTNGNLASLSSEVDAIPVVTPNPGGSGTNLNTIQIGDTIYSISGGGGGGGSSVTPNPAGAATDVLNKVDIDGTIFAMPSDVEANPAGSGTANLTKLKVGSTIYDVQNLTVDNTIDDASSNPIANSAVANALEKTDFLNTDAEATTNIRNSGNAVSTPVVSSTGLDLTPGTWIIYGTIYHFARSHTNATIDIYSSLVDSNGNSLSPYVAYENEISCYGTNNPGSSRSTMMGIVKLTTNETIKLRTIAYNLYNSLSEWEASIEISAIRIR